MNLSEMIINGMEGREFIYGQYFNSDMSKCDVLGAMMISLGMTPADFDNQNRGKELLVDKIPVLDRLIPIGGNDTIPLWAYLDKLQTTELGDKHSIDGRLKCISFLQHIESRGFKNEIVGPETKEETDGEKLSTNG